jgi:hypothetical protein
LGRTCSQGSSHHRLNRIAAVNDGLVDDLKPIVAASVAGRSANTGSQGLRE